MSTILDALRRAEAERSQPPDAQPRPAPGRPPASPPRPLRPRLLGGLGLLLITLTGMLLLNWSARSQDIAPPQPVAAAPAPSPAPTQRATPPSPALLEAPGARVLPAPAATAPNAAASSPAPLQVRASAAAPQRPPRLAELPAALRQQLPALQVSGSMYSPDARLRSLILNGQLFREGDSVAPGVELLEIQPQHALLRFRGQVFELGI